MGDLRREEADAGPYRTPAEIAAEIPPAPKTRRPSWTHPLAVACAQCVAGGVSIDGACSHWFPGVGSWWGTFAACVIVFIAACCLALARAEVK